MEHHTEPLYIRNEYLETYAESTAKELRPDRTEYARVLIPPLRRALRCIDTTHARLQLQWGDVPTMPGAVRWLLDNHYLARREGLTAIGSLAGREPLRLSGGVPLVFACCDALVRAGGAELTAHRLELFLRGFQRSCILTGTELALLPCVLRCALLLRLSDSCRSLDDGGTEAQEQELSFLFSALRFLSAEDLTSLIERADLAEQMLRQDPAGVYPRMDAASRAHYRQQLSALAARHGRSEYQSARLLLSLARRGSGIRAHVGWYLFEEPLGYRKKVRRGGLYIACNLLLTLFLSLLFGYAARSVSAAFLLIFPFSALVKTLLDSLLLRTVPPARLPCLSLKDGVPPEGRTLCAVSCLLCNQEDGKRLAQTLENHYLCSRDCGDELRFALLADLPDTAETVLPGAEEWISSAADAVEALNRRWGMHFFLLTRPRVCTAEGRCMGWERKRGAILETMRLLRGQESSVRCVAGDPSQLKDVRFLLTLDADTRLPPETAKKLIGTALHPLNRPVVDETTHTVIRGHGILSPRIGVDLRSAVRSDFSMVFAGQGGADHYSSFCGEVYMDNWASGGFSGKGLINIDAYLQCMTCPGRMPEGRILSHDAVEGAFLRGGSVSCAEVSDAFPSSPLSYYQRLHRWVRGDWQNCLYLFRAGRVLPDMERFRLFDSLRRSLLPPMTLLALCVGFFLPRTGTLIAALTALLSCLSRLLLTAAETLLQRQTESGLRFHSRILQGIGGSLVHTLLELILLPVEAWFCLDAIIRALWRMLISKRRLLQWQTAWQSDAASSGLLRLCAAAWPAAGLGLALLIFSPVIPGRAAGFLWLLSPLCAFLLGLPREDTPVLTEQERIYLTGCARDIWRWFSEYLTPEDHYLPPDNLQLQPPTGTAHRTSPTNIGLALLSVLSAADLALISAAQAAGLIAGCLSTLEHLETCRGHFYNWYNTRTLQPLPPRCISTVDSGNLCACLIALKNGLTELGYADLAARTGALISAMDFAPLYDRRRRLFHISMDSETDTLSESCYDLFASEARLTSYLAVARGQVPRRHWRQLSRAQVQKGSYRGCASWTGTMFEYLMPELLLPLFRDSLLYENARFCLYAQKQRVAGKGLPWGISESAFYALDPAMNYRYKAHGCAALALKPGMDDELVLSPYSCFLALAVQPKAALRNLQRLEHFGMRGEYGFWEALDCTPGRSVGSKGEIVRCVMAHHLGMSLTAITNCLTGGIHQRRFLRDPEMRAYDILLQEKVPLGGILLRRASAAPRKDPPVRAFTEHWEHVGEGTDFLCPDTALLSSQTYHLMLTESGLSLPRWGALCPYLPPSDCFDCHHGIDLIADAGGESVSLLPELTDDSSVSRRWRFTPEDAVIFTNTPAFSAEVRAALPKAHAGEIRRVTITSRGNSACDICISLRFTPLLAPYNDYLSHPAFCKLGLEMRCVDGALLIRRLPRRDLPECFMALACSLPCGFFSLPDGGSGRDRRELSLTENGFFPTEPCVLCRAAFSAEPGQAFSLTFSLAAAATAEAALSAARRALSLSEEDVAALPRAAAAVMGMDRQSFFRAWSLLPRLFFPAAPHAGSHYRDLLWKFGISGDLPVLCVDFTDLHQADSARDLMDSHLLLCGSGADFDMVFIVHDAPGYLKPLRSCLDELLWRNGGDALSGAKGGVHILSAEDGGTDVAACAALCLDLAHPDPRPSRNLTFRAVSLPVSSAAPAPEFCWDAENRFSFTGLPPRVWSNLLTNGRLSFLAADSGCGNLWYLNSRENPISPWLCRPAAVTGPETLFCTLPDGSMHSLFTDSHGDCLVRFAPGTAQWESAVSTGRVRVTAFIPPDTDARVLLLEFDSLPPGTLLHHCLPLQLAPRIDDARFCCTSVRDGVFCAANDRAIADARPFSLCTFPAAAQFTCEYAAARAFDYNGAQGLCARPVFAYSLPAAGESVIVCGCEAQETLSALTAPTAARAALARTEAYWQQRCGCFRLCSPLPELDRLMNSWCAYQTLACRILARCSIYQSGGAYGFRDQLQDTVNLLLLDPAPARLQILRSCAHQYTEGDVQHWWHEGDGTHKGVRTRCSDDLLWLPWALCEYVRATGDRSLAGKTVSFLRSPPLSADEQDRYEPAIPGAEAGSVMEHCRRALKLVLDRGTGPHGLLKIGAGDWNDGFDLVGGESQWLTWFFCLTAHRFADLSDDLSAGTGESYRRAAVSLTAAANAAWDGEWFLRGYFADGTPLGSRSSSACRIDSIAQSFAAFCPGADPEKVRTALQSAVNLLHDSRNGLTCLFSPPFRGAPPHPGYIESYGPGFRENGGQYTHAALWLILALLRSGDPDTAWLLLRGLLPAEKNPLSYKGEPFVIAADVYAADGHVGEAGWTWYTGSAGWMLRIVLQELLGLQQEGGLLYLRPRLPKDFPGFSCEFRGLHIDIRASGISVDGRPYAGEGLPLPVSDNSQ